MIISECSTNPAYALFEQSGEYNAYIACLSTSLVLASLCFVISSVTGNTSQVDKLWSISPVLYAWFAVVDARTFVMAILATIWGARLTYNFARRGGYCFPEFWKGDEDYRWAILRQGRLPGFGVLTSPTAWFLFNLVFVSLFQHLLLLLIVCPSLVAWKSYRLRDKCTDVVDYVPGLVTLDFIAALLFIFFIVTESIADNQQYVFQTEKYRRKNAGELLDGEYLDGFLQSGLFSIVRKPNYASEQLIWCSYYLFSVASRGFSLLNWSLLGPVLLILLFQSSGWMTEWLTIQKYPKYLFYQQRVPLYVPKLKTFASLLKSKAS